MITNYGYKYTPHAIVVKYLYLYNIFAKRSFPKNYKYRTIYNKLCTIQIYLFILYQIYTQIHFICSQVVTEMTICFFVFLAFDPVSAEESCSEESTEPRTRDFFGKSNAQIQFYGTMVAKWCSVPLLLVCLFFQAARSTSATGFSIGSSTILRASIARGGAQTKTNVAVGNNAAFDVNYQPPPGNVFLETAERTSYVSVVCVAAANLCLNLLRSDPSIPWQMKVPRVLWEIAIMILAMTATDTATALPAIYILLAFVLASTAVVDIFVWAPLFASFANFETCQGGIFSRRVCRSDYTKGIGRLVVVVQCLGSGLFYLMSAISAMGSYTGIRDEQKMNRHIQTMEQWAQLQQQRDDLRLKNT